MDIPAFLLSEIEQGNVVLMLGAGASMESTDPKGQKAPSSKELGRKLADKFLGGKFKDYPLDRISEYAISESNLYDVQKFICDLFEHLEPSKAHCLLPTFRWRGLATTNYDLLVEKAYRNKSDGQQNIVPFVDNSDKVDTKMRDANALAYLKLHGCITRIVNENCPLILTPDQFLEYEEGRKRVFGMFIEWANERPIVFIGYKLQDPNFRSIITTVSKQQGELRPRYYMITPDVDPIEARMWEKKHITMISGTFEDFMTTTDSKLTSLFRGLKKTAPTGNIAITERFIKKDVVINDNCIQFLTTDVDYVKAVKITKQVDPKDFYKGINPGWSAIEQNLDVRRGLVDTILSDHFLNDKTVMDNLQFIVVKGHAGAGKSTLLHRIAWDAAHDYDKLCLYLNPSYGLINTVALQQIIECCKERVYLFIEDAPNRIRELESLTNAIGEHGKYLTVIASARINEWNMSCENLSSYVTNEYELKYLSHKDIDNLLVLLERHNALGTLSNSNMEDRRKAFVEHADRQLLVALHEATLGKAFEEIITDEYNNIRPPQAQSIYLTICVLNRFDVPVRAGLISRIHGVTFEEFSKRFFMPLERIIESIYNPIIRDYQYKTRHAHIAEIIFEDILRKPEEKYHEYLKGLRQLNLSYETDRSAFNHMIKGRALLDMFPDHSMVQEIYRQAEENAGPDQYLLHQKGIYEMNRPNGNLYASGELLDKALELFPNNHTVQHSIAECCLKRAGIARTVLEKDKSLEQATRICLDLKRVAKDSFAITTLVKIDLLKLKEELESSMELSADNSVIERYTKDIEKELNQGLQKFPMDPVLLNLDSQFASLIMQSKRAIESLRKSFEANPRNAYVAIRLADCQKKTSMQDAESTLKQAVEASGFNRQLHYAYGKLLLEMGTAANETLEHHFRRSYSPGDSNYDAQLLHARQLYINGEDIQNKALFKQIGSARLPSGLRNKAQYPLDGEFAGYIVRMEATYCFILRDGVGDWIYVNPEDFLVKDWTILTVGTRVRFNIAFSMKGPRAINVVLE
jgi:hypothetical protein